MLKYKFYYRQEKPRFLRMDFEPKLPILTCYLDDVFKSSYDWVREGIDSVLNGEADCIERNAEWYGAKITKEITTFYVTIDEDNHDEDIVSTLDFKEIFEIWVREKEKMLSGKKGKGWFSS